MPSELERRLERVLTGAPGPDPSASARALRAALEALPSPAEVRRARRRRAALLVAACLAAFVSGGVTLAATGAHLPVVNPDPGPEPGTRPGPPPPASAGLPGGTSIWAVTGGRVMVITKEIPVRAFHGRRVSAFAASPGSLYAVEGRGTTLRAIEIRNQRLVWRRRFDGRPVAAVWSPFPIRIAYLLRTRAGFTVGDLWGTGTHPFTVDVKAAPVAPAWRWDSKALAYVTAAGAVVVHDVIGGANRALPRACGIRSPAAIAFGPAGAALAVADRDGRVALVDTAASRAPRCLTGPAGSPHLAWLGRDGLLAAAGSSITRYALAGPRATARTVAASLPIAGLDVSPDRARIAVLLRSPSGTNLVVTTPPRLHGGPPTLTPGATLLRLRGPAQVQWR
jgi:hypothetical protein